MAAEEATLEEFIADHAVARRCWACNLPPDIREQVDAARRLAAQMSNKNPLRPTTDKMVAWLKRRGFGEVSRGKLNNHFAEGHHRE